MSTLEDIAGLQELGWTWTQIGAHYGTSERGVRRWVKDGTAPPGLAPPAALRHYKMLVVSDTQFPHIDRDLWETTLQIADDAGVEEVVFDGDMWDFEQLGSYKHNPYRIRQAKDDIRDGRQVMVDPLDELTTVKTKRFSLGNHEWRAAKYFDLNAGALGVDLDWHEFMELDQEWEIAPYGKAQGVYPTPELLVAHGWRANKYTAANTLADIGSCANVIIGHTHRVGTFFHQTPLGLVRAYEIGHMADVESLPKAVPGWQNWTQMAGVIVTVARDGSYFDVEMNPVVGDGVVLANDREYRVS